MKIEPITTTEALESFCKAQKGGEYITVDTEFIRDKTYWPQLCLIQIGGVGGDAAIDTLADDLDLSPLFELMDDQSLIKVFHAGRQDLEIFLKIMGRIPAPIFDTQVAAMVCGFGDQVGYETLVQKICSQELDKSSRFTDWARRPLTDRQLQYALGDVIYLKTIYEKLNAQLQKTGREHWLEEEMRVLTSEGTYRVEPDEAWRRLKTRGAKPRFLGILKEVAAWREREAQSQNVPRNRIVKDDTLLDIAANAPTSTKDLSRMRGVPHGFADGRYGAAVIEAVLRAKEIPDRELPRLPKKEWLPPGIGPLTDLLKVLLKRECEIHGVATRLVANADDLERIAADDNADVPALKGWRREIFGSAAIDLKHGRIALTAGNTDVRIVRLDE